MTKKIRELIQASGRTICPRCGGTGEITTFCGHDIQEECHWCDGNGVVKSTKKVKKRDPCHICGGRGGPGCCNNKGYHEYETYELV